MKTEHSTEPTGATSLESLYRTEPSTSASHTMLPTQQDISTLKAKAQALEKQMEVVANSLSKAMRKLVNANTAHLRLGKQQTLKARVLADQAEMQCLHADTVTKIAAITAVEAMKNDITKTNMDLLEERKEMLEKMLNIIIPERLRLVNMLMPVSEQEAKQTENLVTMGWVELRRWRLWAADPSAWHLDGEPATIVQHDGLFPIDPLILKEE